MATLVWPLTFFVVTGAVCLTLEVGRRRWGLAPRWFRAVAFWLFGLATAVVINGVLDLWARAG